MKIGLLTECEISEFRENTLAPILKDADFKIEMVLVDRRPGKSLKQRLIDNIKRGRGGYVIVMAWERFYNKLFVRSDSEKKIEDFCAQHQIKLEETMAPYSKATIEKVKSYDLDMLLLIDGFGIVKKRMLDTAKIGVLSYHHGNMRNYRGMPPAFWELYNNETEMGVTVQILTAGSRLRHADRRKDDRDQEARLVCQSRNTSLS